MISGPEEYRDPQYDYIDFDQVVQEMDISCFCAFSDERHEQAMSLSKQEYHENMV
ncbi:MAG: hypothetical protein ACLSA6_11840 [Holdemania massiliensis]